MRLKLLLLAFTTLSAITFSYTAAGAELSYKQSGNKYTIENNFYRAVVSNNGGRIITLYDKKAGADITKYNGPGRLGGLLDDKDGFTKRKYNISLLRKSEKMIELRMSANNGRGLSLLKFVYFYANRPVIRLRQHYSNGTQSDHTFWIRNFIFPGGHGITKKRTKFFLPLKSGWTTGFPRGATSQVRGNWAAVIDQPTKSGFAAIIDPSLIKKFLFWRKGPEAATFEWIERPIPAGRTALRENSYLVLLHGMKQVTLVTKNLAANIQPEVSKDRKVSITGQLMALNPKIEKATISATLLNQLGRKIYTWDKKPVQLSGVNKPISLSLDKFKKSLPEDTRYTLLATIKIGKKQYKAAPVQFKVGHPESYESDNKNVIFPPVKQPKMKLGHVKGWVNAIEKFGINSTDRKRGFWLSRGKGKYRKRIKNLPVKTAVGLNETQALHFTVNSLSDIKNTEISLTGTRPLIEHMEFFQQKDNHHLKPLTNLSLDNGSSSNIWIIFNPTGLSAGQYKQNLQLTIGSKKIEIPFKARVYPIHLPKKRYLPLKGYAYWPRLAHGYKMTGARIKRLDTFVKAYAKMGGSTFGWATNLYRILPHLKIKGTNKLVSQYIKKHPLSLDDLPDLNFSYFDPVFNIYKKYGMHRFEMPAPLYPMKNITYRIKHRWFRHNKKIKVGTPEADKIAVWYYFQLRKYAKKKGATSFWGKISDEFGPNKVPRWIESAKIVREAGYRTYSTITGSLLRSVPALRTLNPYMDEWQLHFQMRDIFYKLIHDKYKMVTKNIPLKGRFGHYKNGGAKNTWTIKFFGTLTKYGLNQLDNIEVFEDGKPLKAKGGSPWGNKQRGCFLRPHSSVLYISPSTGTPKDHKYKVKLTVHVPDSNGKKLLTLDPNDQLWFYRAYRHTSTQPYNRARTLGWFAADENLDGFAKWTYYWGQSHKLSDMVFYHSKTNTLTLTPIYWGVRDGWEEGQYLSELLDGMSSTQRKKTLSKIFSKSNGSPLQLSNSQERTKYTAIMNRQNPNAWYKAKSIVLKELVKKGTK